jgi:hypothetical protein
VVGGSEDMGRSRLCDGVCICAVMVREVMGCVDEELALRMQEKVSPMKTEPNCGGRVRSGVRMKGSLLSEG